MGNEWSVQKKIHPSNLCKGILFKSDDDGFLYFAYTEKDEEKKDVVQYHMIGHFDEEDSAVAKATHFGRTHKNVMDMDRMCHTYFEKKYATEPLSEIWVNDVIQMLRDECMLTDELLSPVRAGLGTGVPIYELYIVDLVTKDVISFKSAKFL